MYCKCAVVADQSASMMVVRRMPRYAEGVISTVAALIRSRCLRNASYADTGLTATLPLCAEGCFVHLQILVFTGGSMVLSANTSPI